MNNSNIILTDEQFNQLLERVCPKEQLCSPPAPAFKVDEDGLCRTLAVSLLEKLNNQRFPRDFEQLPKYRVLEDRILALAKEYI